MKMNDVSLIILDEIQGSFYDDFESSPDVSPEWMKDYVETLIRSGSLHDDWEDEQDKWLHDIENAQWDLIAKYINDMEY